MADTKLAESEEKFFSSRGEEGGPEPEPATPPEQITPEPETSPEAVPTVDKTELKPSMVPQQALHEERERRKTEKKAREEAERKVLTLETRFKTLEDLAKGQPKPAPDEIPNVDIDPVGHFKAKTAQLERDLAETRKWRQEQEHQSEAVNNVQRLSQLAQAKEAEFKTTTPDYDAASTHLRNLRDAQLQAFGKSDPAERMNIIAQDAIAIAADAFNRGVNPAQVIYDMAKASGYQAKAPEAPKPNGKGPTEEEKVIMAAKGQKAGQSLGQINGASSPPTTLDAIAKMSDDEFAEATKGDKWRKLFGA